MPYILEHLLILSLFCAKTVTDKLKRLSLHYATILVQAETHPQGASLEKSFKHGSLRQILLSIITLPATPTTMEQQHGLRKGARSKNGRRTALYCGSVAIVRSALFLHIHGY
jgi:hypothetical protein